MARMKAKNRRDTAGHKFRENQNTTEDRRSNQENKRLRSNKAKRAVKQNESTEPLLSDKDSASNAPETTVENEEIGGSQISAVPTSTEEISWSATLKSSPLFSDLEKMHTVTSMSIISSSKIQKKATRCIALLSVYPTIPPVKPAVVVLYAKASVASKMISIVEIVKREIIVKGGKWYQYNEGGQVMEERRKIENSASEKRAIYGKDDEGMDSGSEDFETMKTPFERAIEGQPKIRAVPTLTIYLSRVRIESLQQAFGEQTNALQMLKK